MCPTLAVASGWNKDGKKLYNQGGVEIHNGDFVSHDEGKTIGLICWDIENFNIFDKLIPIMDWVGKTISEVAKINGTSIAFSIGRSLTNDDAVYVIRFTDGTTSALFFEGSCVVSSFEDERAPNIDLLIDAGMLTAEDKKERDEEHIRYRFLHGQVSKLTERRSKLQQSLLNADRRKGHVIYRQIKKIECELEDINDEIENYPWRWACWSFDLQCITKWIPNLVDLFNYRTAEHQFGRKVDEMLDSQGRQIITIHKIFDASGTNKSQDVYALEFADGTFSVPVGLCSRQDFELPMEGLLQVGLVSDTKFQEAKTKLSVAKACADSIFTNYERLHQLQDKLKRHCLGERRTRKILQEIETLKGLVPSE